MMSSHFILDALDDIVEGCGGAEPNPITSLLPTRGATMEPPRPGVAVRQAVQLNGPRVAETVFTWGEKPDGSYYMTRSAYPEVVGGIGVDSLPLACFRDVMFLYSREARIVEVNVEDDTILVYVLNADGEVRVDKHRFRKRRHKFRRPGENNDWKLVPYGGE